MRDTEATRKTTRRTARRTAGRTAKESGKESRMSRTAVELFDSGFNCAESVLLSARQALGLRSSAFPRIATGFGGGVGRKGSLCGALTGAVMGIGLAHGRLRPGQNKERAYALARKTLDRFKARFGSPYCRDLINVNLNTKAGQDKYHRLNMHSERCAKYVAACAGMLEEAQAPGSRTSGPGSARKRTPRAERKMSRRQRGRPRGRLRARQ
ncbi:MAG: C_GCAxxG_C_C family protein [Candidatus Eisenbacteria bacterium]|nr:C_GCAxxG_C_C family protein [Candidatus Eisenbacteria bacterium]